MSEDNEKQVSIAGRNVLVAIPTIDGSVDVRIASQIMEASKIFAAHGANLGMAWMSYCSSISKARNALATRFVQLGEEWTDFFFVDADTVFRAQDMVRVVARSTEYPLVAGGVPIKRGDGGKAYRLDYADDCEPNEDGLIKLKRVGTAFMNMRREVLEGIIERGVDSYWVADLKEEHWCFFTEVMKDGHHWGEDYYFCNRLWKDDVGMWLDPHCEFAHVKQVDIVGCFQKDLEAGMQEIRSDRPAA